MAMQIINQIGHLQHWGLTPATNFLSFTNSSEPLKVLLTGTCDIRHILKTLTDIDIENKIKPTKIEIYFHQTHKQLLCRSLLFLHIIHQVHLNFDERVELFLDLYGNALIKQRNSRYVSNLKNDILNLIHGQKKILTPLKNFVKLNMLKFEERDEMSQIIQAWSNKIEYDIVKLRDQRLRFMFKERYDYRTNLVDWDYSMLLTQYAPIIHFYHYKQWRLSGLAFEQRFSSYTEPNRTLASYVPGRKKVQKTSCLVRGYWGDMIISPYISMGIETNSDQKQLLFKKANMKFIGHSIQLTEYNLRYWLQRIEKQKTYEKQFHDYYRTDEAGKKKLEQKEELKKKKKKMKQDEGKQLKQIEEKQNEDDEKQDTNNQSEKKGNEEQIKEKAIKEKKSVQNEELDSEEEERKARVEKKNLQDIKPLADPQSIKLRLFEKYGVEFYPLSMSFENLTKPKFKDFFDVIVCGFTHSAYLSKDRYLQSTLKKGGNLYIQTARYIVPKKKQERSELHQKLKQMPIQKPTKEGQSQIKLKLLDDGVNHIAFTRIE